MMIKEKVENILSNFLERNKEYAIHAYLISDMTGKTIARLLIPIDRAEKPLEDRYVLEWSNTVMKHDNLSIPYDEVMDCYEKNYEENGLRIAEDVIVVLKNDMKIDFECCGERM